MPRPIAHHRITWSVIIPTFERPRHLAQCLRSLAAIDWPGDDIEVIVVDDGGTAALGDSVGRSGDDIAVTLVRQRNAGPGAARNRGAALARGTYLAFTDDDCRPRPGWLRALWSAMARGADMAGGPTVNIVDDSAWSRTSQLIVEAAYGYHNDGTGGTTFLASNNMAVAAHRFRDIGGFDPRFRPASEDRDLCDRWLAAGYSIEFAPGAVVDHASDLDLPRFCRQHFNYGRGARLYHGVRRQRGRGGLARQAAGHLAFLGMFGAPLARMPRHRVPPMAARLALWQVLNIAGYLYQSAIAGAAPIRPERIGRDRVASNRE